MTKEELKQYLIDEAGKSPKQVELMDSYDLFNAWLVWNGICGFTDDIIEVYNKEGKVSMDDELKNLYFRIERL